MGSIDRQKLIIDAATRSFTQFGYKATTIETIAKMANVGKGTIYTFFSNKEELFDEILTKALRDLNDVLKQGMIKGESFGDRIFRMLDLILDLRGEHELFGKIAQESRDFGTLQADEGIRKFEATILRHVEEILEEAVISGDIEACDPHITAFLMIEIYIDLTIEWNKENRPMEKQQIKEYFLTLIFNGLVKKR